MIMIESITNEHFFVACNPLIDVFHCGTLPIGTKVESGQPFMAFGTIKESVIDLIFSEYYEEEEGEDLGIDTEPLPNVPHSFAWSVYFNEADIDEVVSTINNFDFLIVNKIKHPTENKWAIPVNDAVFNALPDGSGKTFLYNKAVASISEGRRFDTATMTTDGWV